MANTKAKFPLARIDRLHITQSTGGFSTVALLNTQEMNAESTLTVRWPTITATAPGRLVGRLASLDYGFGTILTFGVLTSVATLPISLAVYAWQLMPFLARRYRLTDRRIMIQRGLTPADGPSIAYEDFDSIEVETLPGQAWLHTGDLVFKQSDKEVFRLAGVSRPEIFRQICLDAQDARLLMPKTAG